MDQQNMKFTKNISTSVRCTRDSQKRNNDRIIAVEEF